ncbi:MarC family protein, partial [Vibrio parahaemolyticus]|nr:MarC family protein [Vibrio parahaemolyticus]
QTVAMMLLVLLVVYILLLMASGIHRIIGNTGASAVSRIMGLILAAVATTNTLNGIESYFDL